MADVFSTLQAQISNQIVSINAAINSHTISADIKNTLVSNAATLQGFLNTLLSGGTLTAAQQAQLSNSLDTSQKAILAQQAQTTQTIIFVSAGLIVIGITIFLIVRHQKKKSA